MQSLLLRYSFVTGPAIDQSQDLVIMTRSQLLENGMLLRSSIQFPPIRWRSYILPSTQYHERGCLWSIN